MAFVSSVPVPYIDAAGLHVPDFTAIYNGLAADFRSIYGQDVVLDPATLDGQWLAILATAFKNVFDSMAAVYEAFSPQSAQGVGLSSVVKVNGITRKSASYSTATVTVIGQPRTYTNVLVGDGVYQWVLPASFTIPATGTIDLTATCQTIGAVTADVGAISQIATPTLGLQSVSNAAPASVGLEVETDAALRVRQGLSVARPSQTVLDGIVADLLTLPGVVQVKPYENDLDTVDANDIPPHGTAFVVDGGDAQAICQAIALKKTQGSPTYGNTYQTVLQGVAQIPRRINFFRPVRPVITYLVQVATLPGYTLDTRAAIQQALADFTNGLGIGGSIAINDAYAPVLGVSIGGARPFKVKSITVARGGAQTQAADVPIAFYEAAMCAPSNVRVAEVAA